MARSPVVAWLASASLVAVLFLSGCGSSSSSASKSALEKDARRFADAVCTAYENCGCMGASALADCKAAYGEYMMLMFAELMVSLPGAQVDQAKFDACMTEAETLFATCPAQMNLGAASSCSGNDGPGFMVGSQGDGAWCEYPESCAPGLGCDEASWTCKAKIALAQDCSASTVGCQDGLYCNGSGLCAAKLGADAACDASDACQPGLTCAGGTPKCTAPHAISESCTDGAGCVSGAYCDGICAAQKEGGVMCSYDNECLSDNCSGTCDPASFCSTGMFKM